MLRVMLGLRASKGTLALEKRMKSSNLSKEIRQKFDEVVNKTVELYTNAGNKEFSICAKKVINIVVKIAASKNKMYYNLNKEILSLLIKEEIIFLAK